MARAGYQQQIEENQRLTQPLVSIGEDLEFISSIFPNGDASYSAKDVFSLLQSDKSLI